MKVYILYVLMISFLILGCYSKRQNNFYSFIESNCSFEKSDTAYIDFQKYFQVEYDTMWVFGEYTPLAGVKLILGMQDYESCNMMMPKGILVQDSYNKIILVKEHNIVFDKDVKVPYLYSDGIELKRQGVFDRDSCMYYAKYFTTSKFMVVKEKYKNGYYYIYRNVLSDGSLIPCESTESTTDNQKGMNEDIK